MAFARICLFATRIVLEGDFAIVVVAASAARFTFFAVFLDKIAAISNLL